MTKIILRKNTENGKHYYLVQFDDKYVIFKTTNDVSVDVPLEADFGEKIYENNNRDKAGEFFKDLDPIDSNL